MVLRFLYGSMVDKLMNIGKTVLNITYHPLLDNFEEFENVIEDEGQGRQSNLTYYIMEGTYHRLTIKVFNKQLTFQLIISVLNHAVRFSIHWMWILFFLNLMNWKFSLKENVILIVGLLVYNSAEFSQQKL